EDFDCRFRCEGVDGEWVMTVGEPNPAEIAENLLRCCDGKGAKAGEEGPQDEVTALQPTNGQLPPNTNPGTQSFNLRHEIMTFTMEVYNEQAGVEQRILELGFRQVNLAKGKSAT